MMGRADAPLRELYKMIDVSHVSRNFGDFRAVSDVSFSIPKGQIVGLLGPNGAGKTTTMRMITGFLAPSAGEIFIDGKNIVESPVEAKQKIGYMPESAPLYGDMIVEDYLRYVADIQGENPDVKVPLLCKECGLKEVMSKNISELSRGNRQRVALAHALMHDPEILILDEPTTGLDYRECMEVMEKIRALNENGTTVIMVCHDMEVVLDFAKEVMVMNRGEILAKGATRDILGNKELLDRARLLPPQIAQTAMLLTEAGKGYFKNVFTVEEMIKKIKEAK